MKYCSSCEVVLEDEYDQCPYCGSKTLDNLVLNQDNAYSGNIKLSIEVRGVSKNFTYNGSYEALKLGDKELSEALEIFERLPTTYSSQDLAHKNESLVNMVIHNAHEAISITMLELNDYYITGMLKDTGGKVVIMRSASRDKVIEIIKNFYTKPYYVKSIQRDKIARVDKLLDNIDHMVIYCKKSLLSGEGEVIVNRSSIAGIPLRNIIEIEISRGLRGIKLPQLRIRFHDDKGSISELKLHLTRRSSIPIYHQYISKVLPGKIRVKG